MSIRWPVVFKLIKDHGTATVALVALIAMLAMGIRSVWSDALLPTVRQVTNVVANSAARIETKMDKIEIKHEQLVDAIERLDRNQQAQTDLQRITNDLLRQIQADALAAAK